MGRVVTSVGTLFVKKKNGFNITDHMNEFRLLNSPYDVCDMCLKNNKNLGALFAYHSVHCRFLSL